LLVAGAAAAAGPAASIHWKPELHEFPTLGYRAPVDLVGSALAVDRILSDKPVESYNCHYYTKTHIEGAEPAEQMRDDTGQEMLSDLYLQQHDYVKAEGLKARAGDIVTALRPPQAFDERTYLSHSGVVVDVAPDGTILAVRQKFSPSEPVVDLTLDEFVTAYSGKYPWQCVVWSRSVDVTSDR
jgi:hypothetical protein